MPKGHVPKREKKRAKQKAAKPSPLPPDLFTSAEVEVVKKRKKSRRDEEP